MNKVSLNSPAYISPYRDDTQVGRDTHQEDMTNAQLSRPTHPTQFSVKPCSCGHTDTNHKNAISLQIEQSAAIQKIGESKSTILPNYVVLCGNAHQMMTIREVVTLLNQEQPRPMLWSARLSTGILGLPDCPSGKYGPKGPQEVILALGDSGLKQLLNMGFLCCPSCHPEQQEGFWDSAQQAVENRWGQDLLQDFLSHPYDARNMDLETILPLTGAAPNRFYLAKGLSQAEVTTFVKRLQALNIEIPPIGYYSKNHPDRFVEYSIS